VQLSQPRAVEGIHVAIEHARERAGLGTHVTRHRHIHQRRPHPALRVAHVIGEEGALRIKRLGQRNAHLHPLRARRGAAPAHPGVEVPPRGVDRVPRGKVRVLHAGRLARERRSGVLPRGTPRIHGVGK